MNSNKFVRNFSKLNKKEVTRFREFAHSPYFNKHQELRRLVTYLSEIYPRFDEKNCKKELLFAEIFGDDPFDEGRLAPLLTYGQRLLEQFWTYEVFEDDAQQQQLYLLQGLRSHEMYHSYQRILEKADPISSEQVQRDSRQLLNQYLLKAEAVAYHFQIEKHEEEIYWRAKLDYLDYHFLAEKLRDACEYQVRKNILKTEFQLRLLEPVLTEVQQNQEVYEKIPPIHVYYHVYLMLTREEYMYYQQALAALKKWEDKFSRDELIFIYNYFMNFCIGHINRGESRFLEDIFELYQVQLDRGLLLEDGFLSEWDYKNIVTTGIRLNRLDWVREFIETFKEKLHPDVVDNAYRFNLANYCYSAGEYDKVLDLLIRVEYSDLRYNLGAKALLLRTYYDLGEFDPLNSLAESFRQYLLRNKLMADVRRTGYYNLFKITRKAAYLRSRLDYVKTEKARQDLDKIKEELSRAGNVFNRAWLEEKIEELSSQIA